MAREVLVGLYSIPAFNKLSFNTGASVDSSFPMQDATYLCQ